MDDAPDAFDAITDALRREAAWDQEAEARDVIAAGKRDRSFLAQLRGIAPGEVVTLTLADGTALTGRLAVVGLDWIQLLEVTDPVGTARTRVRRRHDVPVHAVARVSREAR